LLAMVLANGRGSARGGCSQCQC